MRTIIILLVVSVAIVGCQNNKSINSSKPIPVASDSKLPQIINVLSKNIPAVHQFHGSKAQGFYLQSVMSVSIDHVGRNRTEYCFKGAQKQTEQMETGYIELSILEIRTPQLSFLVAPKYIVNVAHKMHAGPSLGGQPEHTIDDDKAITLINALVHAPKQLERLKTHESYSTQLDTYAYRKNADGSIEYTLSGKLMSGAMTVKRVAFVVNIVDGRLFGDVSVISQ